MKIVLKLSVIIISLIITIDLYSQNDILTQQIEKLIISGKYNEATEKLISIHDTMPIDSVDQELRYWLRNLLFLQKDWNRLIQYSEKKLTEEDDSTLYSIAKFISKFQGEEILFQNETAPEKYRTRVTPTPRIEIRVNNHKYHFWVDTGAGLTVLSSEVAQACEVTTSVISGATATAITGKKLDIAYGIIDSLFFAGVKVKNHPCIIIPRENLLFKVAGIRFLKIDGIIGWNLLQELALTINTKDKNILFEPSKTESNDGSINLFWMDYPIVKCYTGNNHVLWMGLDTGANKSSLHNPILKKIDTTNINHKKIYLGGVAGMERIQTYEIPNFVIQCDDKNISSKNITVQPGPGHGIFEPDGTLGFEELMKYNIFIDFKNGIFKLTEHN